MNDVPSANGIPMKYLKDWLKWRFVFLFKSFLNSRVSYFFWFFSFFLFRNEQMGNYSRFWRDIVPLYTALLAKSKEYLFKIW